MSATPQSIPAPFTADMLPSPSVVPHRTSHRWPLMIGAAVVIGLVAFGGGYAVANATSTRSPGRTFAAANGQGSNGATGTVASVSSGQLILTTTSGSSRIVLLTPTTTVTKVTATTLATSDIATGTQVTVTGTSNPDGSVTAMQVVIGSSSLFRGSGRPGAAATPAASTAP